MPASNNIRRIPIRLEKPNLHWIEARLGESLQTVPRAPSHGKVKPQRDATVIPMGEHCYYPQPMATGYKPCPYFKQTAYGTTRCIYVNVEAYDRGDLSRYRHQLQRHFGSLAKAEAAGVINMFDLPDSSKICGVNMLYPSTVAHHLEPAITDYEQAVQGLRVAEWLYGSAAYAAMNSNVAHLQTAVADRFFVWQYLCSMVEPVPPALVHRIQLADAILRGATCQSDESVQVAWSEGLSACQNPQKQFWYFYRKDFVNPFSSDKEFSRLPFAEGGLPSLKLPLPLYGSAAQAPALQKTIDPAFWSLDYSRSNFIGPEQ